MIKLSEVIDNDYSAIFNTWADGHELPAKTFPSALTAYFKSVPHWGLDWMQESVSPLTATEKGLVKHTKNNVLSPFFGYNTTTDQSTYYFDGDEYVLNCGIYVPPGATNGDQFSFGFFFSSKTNAYYANTQAYLVQMTISDMSNGIMDTRVYSVDGAGVRTAVSQLFQFIMQPDPVLYGGFYFPVQIRRYLNSIYFWASEGYQTPTQIDTATFPYMLVLRDLINASNEKIFPIISHDNDNNILPENRSRFYKIQTSIVKYAPEIMQPTYKPLANGHYSANKLDFVTIVNGYPSYHQYSIDLTAKNVNGVNVIPNSIRVSNVETVDGYVHVYLNDNHYVIKPQSELSLQLNGESYLLVKGEDNCTVMLYESGSLNLYGR